MSKESARNRVLKKKLGFLHLFLTRAKFYSNLMGTRNRFFLFLIAIVSCLMPTGVESSSPPRFGGKLRHAVFQRVTTLDNFNYLNHAELQIASQLYEGLVRHNSYGEIVAGIAQSWKRSADYRTWTFTIAENARFHDGEAVQATDVKRAWERFIKEDCIGEVAGSWLNPLFSIEGAMKFRRGNVDAVSGIRVPDSRHLQVALKQPDTEFLIKLTGPNAWITKPDRPDGPNLPPIGTGRFRLESFQPEEIRIKANADYAWGRPYLDEMTFRYYGEVRQALFDFESGILDSLHLPLTETPRRGDDDSDEILIQTDAAVGVYLGCMSERTDPPAWHDVLKYAVDVNALLRLQYGASSVQATVIQSPRHYDPIKARRRLKSSPAARLIFAPLPDNTGNEIAARLRRSFLSRIGLQVSTVNTDSEALQDALRDGSDTLALLSVPLPQGADAGIDWFNSSDALIPLYALPSNFLCQPRLRNFNIGWGGVVAFDQIWLTER